MALNATDYTTMVLLYVIIVEYKGNGRSKERNIADL
jgi:hypothetical protein